MKNFGNKIKKILKENGYNYRIRIFPRQDKVLKNGKKYIQEYEKVVIYAGRNIEKYNSRRSRKLIVFKNEKGVWEGEEEYLKDKEWMNDNAKGSAVYVLGYHDKIEPVKHTLFSDLWEEDEKEFGGQEKKLLKIMENWKQIETLKINKTETELGEVEEG